MAYGGRPAAVPDLDLAKLKTEIRCLALSVKGGLPLSDFIDRDFRQENSSFTLLYIKFCIRFYVNLHSINSIHNHASTPKMYSTPKMDSLIFKNLSLKFFLLLAAYNVNLFLQGYI